MRKTIVSLLIAVFLAVGVSGVAVAGVDFSLPTPIGPQGSPVLWDIVLAPASLTYPIPNTSVSGYFTNYLMDSNGNPIMENVGGNSFRAECIYNNNPCSSDNAFLYLCKKDDNNCYYDVYFYAKNISGVDQTVDIYAGIISPDETIPGSDGDGYIHMAYGNKFTYVMQYTPPFVSLYTWQAFQNTNFTNENIHFNPATIPPVWDQRSMVDGYGNPVTPPLLPAVSALTIPAGYNTTAILCQGYEDYRDYGSTLTCEWLNAYFPYVKVGSIKLAFNMPPYSASWNPFYGPAPADPQFFPTGDWTLEFAMMQAGTMNIFGGSPTVKPIKFR